MPRKLDPHAPIASLLLAGRITPAELARRLGRAQSNVSAAYSRGAGVTVDYLSRAAKAAGFTLEIRIRARLDAAAKSELKKTQ